VNRSQSQLAATLLVLTVAIAACNGDPLTGPGFTCDVTNPVREITLSPSPGVVVVRSPARASDTLQLKATATNRNGGARTDVPITFSSSDTAVATVDSLGVVHALKPGTVSIKASSCGKSASTQVSVLPAAVSAQITPKADSVLAGDSAILIARAVGQDGKTLAGTVFSFVASPSGSVTLKTLNDSTVRVVGIAPGVTTITATGDGASVTASILVLPRVFLSIGQTGGSFDAGGDLSCGLISLGEGFCWGLNNLGQLGAASDSVCFAELLPVGPGGPALPCHIMPLRFGPSLAFTAVAVGDSSACAIATSGRAYCWGDNTFGQIGNGSTAPKKTPTLVTAGLNFTSISVGGGHACALGPGGAAYCWGQDSSGQLGDARRVHSTTPIPVSDGGGGPAIFTSISAGYRHTCALKLDGSALCWGNNDSAQLGDGTRGSADTPVVVSGGLAFTQISAGGDHTCGIAVGGAAYCWGSNAHGQLGTGLVGGVSAVPLQVAIGLTFSRISASRGTDKSTGRGSQLDTTVNSSGDTVITQRSSVKFDGFGHTCGLTTAGEVYCWGDDSDLQLGRGPITGGPNSASGVPMLVFVGERPAAVTFTTISTGTRHSCAVGSDGNAYCWGSNVFGSLGNTLQAAFRGAPQKVATPR
jgi:alpha-tubulin suppressor-like RCC1 family protein